MFNTTNLDDSVIRRITTSQTTYEAFAHPLLVEQQITQTYGIRITNGADHSVLHDVSPNPCAISRLMDLLVAHDAAPCHLQAIVEDFYVL